MKVTIMYASYLLFYVTDLPFSLCNVTVNPA